MFHSLWGDEVLVILTARGGIEVFLGSSDLLRFYKDKYKQNPKRTGFDEFMKLYMTTFKDNQIYSRLCEIGQVYLGMSVLNLFILFVNEAVVIRTNADRVASSAFEVTKFTNELCQLIVLCKEKMDKLNSEILTIDPGDKTEIWMGEETKMISKKFETFDEIMEKIRCIINEYNPRVVDIYSNLMEGSMIFESLKLTKPELKMRCIFRCRGNILKLVGGWN